MFHSLQVSLHPRLVNMVIAGTVLTLERERAATDHIFLAILYVFRQREVILPPNTQAINSAGNDHNRNQLSLM